MGWGMDRETFEKMASVDRGKMVLLLVDSFISTPAPRLRLLGLRRPRLHLVPAAKQSHKCAGMMSLNGDDLILAMVVVAGETHSRP